MKKEKQERLYNEHKALLHKEVWRVCRKSPALNRDEVLSQAHEIFTTCCDKWQGEKQAKFPTYLTQAMRNSLGKVYWSGTDSILAHDGYDPEMVGVNGMCGPERALRLKQALGGMKPLAVEIVNLVFTFPDRLESLTRYKIREYLWNMGISDNVAITNAFMEIRETLEEV